MENPATSSKVEILGSGGTDSDEVHPTSPALRTYVRRRKMGTNLVQEKDDTVTVGSNKNIDVGWKHGLILDNNRQHWKCKWCSMMRYGGGVSRLKRHLAGYMDVRKCPNVPDDISEEISKHLKAKALRRRNKLSFSNSSNSINSPPPLSKEDPIGEDKVVAESAQNNVVDCHQDIKQCMLNDIEAMKILDKDQQLRSSSAQVNSPASDVSSIVQVMKLEPELKVLNTSSCLGSTENCTPAADELTDRGESSQLEHTDTRTSVGAEKLEILENQQPSDFLPHIKSTALGDVPFDHGATRQKNIMQGIKLRSRNDIGWDYAVMVGTNPRHWRCKYCGRERQTGITRLKMHLADVRSCPKVPQEVRKKIVAFLNQKLVGRCRGGKNNWKAEPNFDRNMYFEATFRSADESTKQLENGTQSSKNFCPEQQNVTEDRALNNSTLRSSDCQWSEDYGKLAAASSNETLQRIQDSELGKQQECLSYFPTSLLNSARTSNPYSTNQSHMPQNLEILRSYTKTLPSSNQSESMESNYGTRTTNRYALYAHRSTGDQAAEAGKKSVYACTRVQYSLDASMNSKNTAKPKSAPYALYDEPKSEIRAPELSKKRMEDVYGFGFGTSKRAAYSVDTWKAAYSATNDYAGYKPSLYCSMYDPLPTPNAHIAISNASPATSYLDYMDMGSSKSVASSGDVSKHAKDWTSRVKSTKSHDSATYNLPLSGFNSKFDPTPKFNVNIATPLGFVASSYLNFEGTVSMMNANTDGCITSAEPFCSPDSVRNIKNWMLKSEAMSADAVERKHIGNGFIKTGTNDLTSITACCSSLPGYSKKHLGEKCIKKDTADFRTIKAMCSPILSKWNMSSTHAAGCSKADALDVKDGVNLGVSTAKESSFAPNCSADSKTVKDACSLTSSSKAVGVVDNYRVVHDCEPETPMKNKDCPAASTNDSQIVKEQDRDMDATALDAAVEPEKSAARCGPDIGPLSIAGLQVEDVPITEDVDPEVTVKDTVTLSIVDPPVEDARISEHVNPQAGDDPQTSETVPKEGTSVDPDQHTNNVSSISKVSKKRKRTLDEAWEHAFTVDEYRRQWRCKWCGLAGYNGVTELKWHLIGAYNRRACAKAPADVKEKMRIQLLSKGVKISKDSDTYTDSEKAQASSDLRRKRRTGRRSADMQLEVANLPVKSANEHDESSQQVKSADELDDHARTESRRSSWRNVLGSLLLSSKLTGTAGVKKCIQDALADGPENSGSGQKPVEVVNATLFRNIFVEILQCEKFVLLCDLIWSNFNKDPEGLFDLGSIHSKLVEGGYEQSPGAFGDDIQMLWSNLANIGQEMGRLAGDLSRISKECLDKAAEAPGPSSKAKELSSQFLISLKSYLWQQENKDSSHLLKIPEADAERTQGEVTKADVESGRPVSLNQAGTICKQLCRGCNTAYKLVCVDQGDQPSKDESWFCAACSVCSDEHLDGLHGNCSVCERLEVSAAPVTRKSRPDALVNDPGESSTSSSDTDDEEPRLSRTAVSRLCKVCRNREDEDRRFLVCGHAHCPYKYYHIRCLKNHQIASTAQRSNRCWYCPSCLCRTCLSDQDDDQIILCDGCDEAYHLYCMVPPRKSVPRGRWYCRSCNVVRAREGMREYEKLILKQHMKNSVGGSGNTRRHWSDQGEHGEEDGEHDELDAVQQQLQETDAHSDDPDPMALLLFAADKLSAEEQSSLAC